LSQSSFEEYLPGVLFAAGACAGLLLLFEAGGIVAWIVLVASSALLINILVGEVNGGSPYEHLEHLRRAEATSAAHPDPRTRSGIEGEARVLETLRWLPAGYRVFSRLHLPNARSRTGTTECDVVLVGPTGVHLLEIKNNYGRILGGDANADLWVFVQGASGEPISMRNPVKQAASQARVMREYLDSIKAPVPIHPAVILSNPDSEWVPGASYQVPVLHLGRNRPLALPVKKPVTIHPKVQEQTADGLRALCRAGRGVEIRR
jgi:hypothetical protein